jgi:hypothetical protein
MSESTTFKISSYGTPSAFDPKHIFESQITQTVESPTGAFNDIQSLGTGPSGDFKVLYYNPKTKEVAYQ